MNLVVSVLHIVFVEDKLTRFGCADIQDKCRLVCISTRSLQLINKNIIKEIEN